MHTGLEYRLALVYLTRQVLYLKRNAGEHCDAKDRQWGELYANSAGNIKWLSMDNPVVYDTMSLSCEPFLDNGTRHTE